MAIFEKHGRQIKLSTDEQIGLFAKNGWMEVANHSPPAQAEENGETTDRPRRSRGRPTQQPDTEE